MDFVATLTRKNSLRSAVKELDASVLEKVISDLAEIKDEIRAQEEEKRREEEERQAKIREIQKQLAELGLSADDLGQVAGGGKPRGKVPPKYRLMGEDGKLHEWSGRGRKPVVFRDYEERGGKLKDLEI